MNEYRVNLNSLLDNNEHFLFDNKAFKALIKHTNDNFTHLVNLNFDLSEVANDKTLPSLKDDQSDDQITF
jgi:hypothetical protein